jgi:hypothetical protein
MNSFYVSFLLLVSLSLNSQADGLPGYWHNEASNAEIKVSRVTDGIEVRRTDISNQNTIRYKYARPGVFQDKDGNIYYWKSDKELQWNSINGNKKLIFFKGRVTQNQGISGTWTNSKLRRKIRLKESDRGVAMRTRNGWTHYYYTSDFTYENRRGDVLKFYSDGRLIWREMRYNRKITFYADL